MKMLPKISMFLAMLGLITFVACEKESNNVAPVQNLLNEAPLLSNVEVVDGRLKISSISALEENLKLIHSKQNLMMGFEEQFKDFVSAQQAFNSVSEEDIIKNGGDITLHKDYLSIVERDGEKYFEPVVDMVHLSYLVNKDGIIQIGDDVIKFTRNHLYKFNVSNMPDYKKFKDRLDLIPNVQKTPVTRTISSSDRWDVSNS